MHVPSSDNHIHAHMQRHKDSNILRALEYIAEEEGSNKHLSTNTMEPHTELGMYNINVEQVISLTSAHGACVNPGSGSSLCRGLASSCLSH